MEVKDYNAMIDDRNFFDQPIKNNLKTYDHIRKIATGQQDDYTAGCLIDLPYFKKYYKLIAIQEINLTGNLDRSKGSTMFFIVEDANETVSAFSKGTVEIL